MASSSSPAPSMASPISPIWNGHIVALEGPSELVSTQLRLLPTSPRILVLPNLQHYMRDAAPDAPLDPSEILQRYRAASQARHAKALEFLRPATTTEEKRLVFLHGGTLSARAACLSAIMAHQTESSPEAADSAESRPAAVSSFPGSPTARSPCRTTDASDSEPTEGQEEPKPAASDGAESGRAQDEQHDEMCSRYMATEDDTIENRIIRAMRAAEMLDKETEFLQPSTYDVDLTVRLVDIPSRTRRRATSSPAVEDDRLTTDAASTGEPASAATRKPPLRIRIPSPSVPEGSDLAALGNRQFPSDVNGTHGPSLEPSPHQQRPRTAGPDLPPRQKQASNEILRGSAFGTTNPTFHHLPKLAAQGDPAPSSVSQTENQSFDTVLPFLEDLVLLFSRDTLDELRDVDARGLKDGSCPGLATATNPVRAAHDALQSATTSTCRNGKASGEEATWTQKGLAHGLPTPGHSPTPLDTTSAAVPVVDLGLRGHNTGTGTPVSVQNSLRSFLASHFPLQELDDPSSDSADCAEGAGLWKPLGCDAGHLSSPDGERRVDLIVAVGAESRVKKSRLSEVVGQLERLGRKASGHTRSGRLDIRYLIASAMQAFTAQPLTKQTQGNPFADRSVLAALIIPHLETHLASHPDVRFLLIEYPADHLPTVLALQKLIGTELMKVVGIVHGDGPSPVRPSSAPSDLSSGPSEHRPSEGFHILKSQGPHMSGALLGSCSFSKANFLLASSATAFETAAFVAAIRESLISISDFYIPDRALYKRPSPAPAPKPACPDINTNPAGNTKSQASSRLSTSTLLITPPSSPTDPSPTSHSSAVATTVAEDSSTTSSSGRKTSRSTHSPVRSSSQPRPPREHSCQRKASHSPPARAHTHHHRSRHRHHHDHHRLAPARDQHAEAGIGTGYYFHHKSNSDRRGGLQGGESEDEDDEERRLMPLYLRRKEETGDRTKALRWLGLV